VKNSHYFLIVNLRNIYKDYQDDKTMRKVRASPELEVIVLEEGDNPQIKVYGLSRSLEPLFDALLKEVSPSSYEQERPTYDEYFWMLRQIEQKRCGKMEFARRFANPISHHGYFHRIHLGYEFGGKYTLGSLRAIMVYRSNWFGEEGFSIIQRTFEKVKMHVMANSSCTANFTKK
jgi:hypothetical protein